MLNRKSMVEVDSATIWHTPPSCQGQHVVTSYAMTPDWLVSRTVDRCDGSVVHRAARWTRGTEAWARSAGPWNSEPPSTRWRQVRVEVV